MNVTYQCLQIIEVFLKMRSKFYIQRHKIQHCQIIEINLADITNNFQYYYCLNLVSGYDMLWIS